MADTPMPDLEALAPRAAKDEPTIFKLGSVELDHGKTGQSFCRSDILLGGVQIVADGGETNLHSHKYLDGFWFVLAGRVRFYTTDDVVIGDLGQFEGIFIPRGYPYWFESSSDEQLQILQVEASSRIAESMTEWAGGRTNYTPVRPEIAEYTAAD